MPREFPRDPAGALAQVRAHLAQRKRQEARSLAHLLRDDASTAELGTLCSAVVATAEGFFPLARALFARVPERMALEHAPSELISALREDDDLVAATRAFRHLVALHAPAERDLGQLMMSASASLECGRLSEARALLDVARVMLWGASEDRQRPGIARALALQGAGPDHSRPGTTIPTGMRLAVIDAASPTASSHPTDVELLVLLAQLAAAPRTTWIDGPNAHGLGGFSVELCATARFEDGPRIMLDVLDSFSDATTDWLASTWILLHGARIDLELARRLPALMRSERCIVLSIEVVDSRALTPELVTWLRCCEPVGCRNWSTVLLMRQAGVQAFFAGSLAVMAGSLVEPLRARLAVRPEAGHPAPPALDPLRARLEHAARQLLAAPATAAARAQFDGFEELSEDEMRAMGVRFAAHLDAVLGPITADEPAERVHKAWRESCKQDLDVADRHCRSFDALPEISLDVDRMVAGVLATRRGRQSEPDASRIELAFAVDDKLQTRLPVVLQSIIEHSSAPMRAHILARGLDPAYVDALERDFDAAMDVEFYDFGFVDYGSGLRMLSHTTVSTLDRLLLPELLPELDRIIYLDVDLLVKADLSELWRLDLRGRRLAAKSSSSPGMRYAHQMVQRALLSLPSSRGSSALRYLHDRYPLLSRAFNAGVLVMNLARMRAENFARQFIPMVENYGMNDQDVLNVYAAADRVELDPAWNAIPRQDLTDEAKIVHFAGPVKPWSELYIARTGDYKDCESRYLARTGRASG